MNFKSLSKQYLESTDFNALTESTKKNYKSKIKAPIAKENDGNNEEKLTNNAKKNEDKSLTKALPTKKIEEEKTDSKEKS